MKIKITLTILLTTLLAPLTAAEKAKTMADCAKLSDGNKRLACYDELSKNPPKASKSKSADGFEIIALPRPSQSKEHQAKKQDPESSFGLEHIEKNSDEKLVSKIEGPFKGWSGKTKFKLANGQIWQQSRSGSFYVNVESPTVIIEKGFMGVYYLKIEGYNKRTAVRRIK